MHFKSPDKPNPTVHCTVHYILMRVSAALSLAGFDKKSKQISCI